MILYIFEDESHRASQITENYVKAIAYDENMQLYEVEGTELLARAICHELDHLDGHLYTERVEGELVNAEDIMSEEED